MTRENQPIKYRSQEEDGGESASRKRKRILYAACYQKLS